MTISKRVKLARVAHGWTQCELADRANVNWRTVSNLENGKHETRSDKLELICAALDIPVDESSPLTAISKARGALQEALVTLDRAEQELTTTPAV